MLKPPIKLGNATIDEWDAWLQEELNNDGRRAQIFNPAKDREALYKYIIEAFAEAIKLLKEKDSPPP